MKMKTLMLFLLSSAALAGESGFDEMFPGARVAVTLKAGAVSECYAVPRRVQAYDCPAQGRVALADVHEKPVAAGAVLFVVEKDRVDAAREKHAAVDQSRVTNRKVAELDYRRKVSDAKRERADLAAALALAKKRDGDKGLVTGLDMETKAFVEDGNRRLIESLEEKVKLADQGAALVTEQFNDAARVYDTECKQSEIEWQNIERTSVVRSDFGGVAHVAVEDLLDARRESVFRQGAVLVVVDDPTQTDVVVNAVSQPWMELNNARLFAIPRLPSGQVPAARFKEMRRGRNPEDASRYTFTFPTPGNYSQLHGKPLVFDIHYDLGAPHQIVSKADIYDFDSRETAGALAKLLPGEAPAVLAGWRAADVKRTLLERSPDACRDRVRKLTDGLDQSRLMASFNERYPKWFLAVEGHAECAVLPRALIRAATAAKAAQAGADKSPPAGK